MKSVEKTNGFLPSSWQEAEYYPTDNLGMDDTTYRRSMAGTEPFLERLKQKRTKRKDRISF